MEIKKTAADNFLKADNYKVAPVNTANTAASKFITLKNDEVSASTTKKGIIPTEKQISFNQSFVKNTNGSFTVDGKPFRYIGTNMYSLAKEKTEVTEKMVRDAAAEGFTVIRFWAFHPMTKDKMKEICDLGQKYNVKFIPDFKTQWSLSEAELKDDQWYKEGYKKEYLPYVKDMVAAFKDRPEIMIWEIINEPETKKFASMYNFTKNVSEVIDKLDKNHLISVGTVGGHGDKFGNQFSRFNEGNFKKLYSLPKLDAVSIHDYSYDATFLERMDILYRFAGDKDKSENFAKWDNITSYVSRKVDKFLLDNFNIRKYNPTNVRGTWNNLNKIDAEIAKDLKKPLFVGEVGFKKIHGEDRKKLISMDISTHIQRGAQGYMLWSFEAQGKSIDGHDYGFNHNDGFSPIIKSWNQMLNR